MGPEARNDCLIFYADNSFGIYVYGGAKQWSGTIEYSTNGTTWTTWDGASTISSSDNKMIYVRGINTASLTQYSTSGSWWFTGSDVHCIGNVESLFNYSTTASGGHITLPQSGLSYLFYGNTELVTGPECLSVKRSGGTVYYCMFNGCSKMVKGPSILPYLEDSSGYGSPYAHMFEGCSSLIIPPKIEKIKVCYNAVRRMFHNCANLEKIPDISNIVTGGDTQCTFEQMFYGCPKIKISATQDSTYKNAYKIPSAGDLTGMFNGTGGSFTGTPTAGATYYTANEVI